MASIYVCSYALIYEVGTKARGSNPTNWFADSFGYYDVLLLSLSFFAEDEGFPKD